MFVFETAIFFIIPLIISLILIYNSTVLVQQAEAIVIERLGKFDRILQPGLHLVIPFIDQTRRVAGFVTFLHCEHLMVGATFRK